MERANAQSFAVAFGCFAVFAVAYTQLEDLIPLQLLRRMPQSMAEMTHFLVMLIFVVANMIVMIRAATIRNLDINRSIYLALGIFGTALAFSLSAWWIDRNLVLASANPREGATSDIILIRPWTIPDALPIKMAVEPVDFSQQTFRAQNVDILSDMEAHLPASDANERYRELVDNNAIVASTYALSIILSRSLLLLALSMLSWTLILSGQKAQSRNKRRVASPPVA